MPIAWGSRTAREGADGWPTSNREWREWQERAQRLDHRELSHRMYELAAALNERDTGAEDRIRALERVRGEARQALDYLAGRIQSQPLPLPASARATYRLAIELIRELAHGYERAVIGNGTRLGRRWVALAVERALALRGEHMLRIQQTYSPVDGGFWERVNALYARAEAAGVAERAVDDPELRFARRPRQSPQAVYKRLLLLSLAGTQGFRRGEAARLWRALESWQEHARLLRGDAAPDNNLPRFAIDLQSDDGPRLQAPGDRAASIRILDVADLVVEVEQLREARGVANKALPAEDEVGPAALARLVESWRPANFKRSRRAHRGSEVDAEVTLRVIHSRLLLEGRPAEERPADQRSAARAAPAAPIEPEEPPADWRLEEIDPDETVRSRHPDEVRSGVNWNEIPHGREHSAAEQEARAIEAGDRAETEGEPRWLLKDVSSSGFRLVWDGEGSCRVAVGEPVALRIDRNGANARWCVGLVRRMRFLDERRFEIGVEVRARNAIAVRVRPEPANRNANPKRDEAASSPALMLPGARARQRPTTLLIPAHLHHTGDVLEVDLHDRTTRIALGALLEDTGTVSQYVVAPAPERGRRARSDEQFVSG